MPLVKFCGIKHMKDARYAVELGVDFIGFLFYEGSKRRYVSPDAAREISRAFPDVKKVALFVDEEDPEKVARIAGYVGVDVLQFHGSETPDYCRRFREHWDVWKALRVKDEHSLEAIAGYVGSIDAILLDKYVKGVPGGTGETFNWELALIAKRYGLPVVLAGGLNPSNVEEAVKAVNPYAVDVSSGIEITKGEKSHEKMREFIEAARIPSRLLDIFERKRKEVEALHASGHYKRCAGRVRIAEPAGYFYNALAAQRTTQSPHLIAEFKRTSPSNKEKGRPPYRANADPAKIVGTYVARGAAAISVLTDREGFDGSSEDFVAARQVVDIPMLRKDFIYDSSQVIEARADGANAVLLITAILSQSDIEELSNVAADFGMDCLVETHNARELERAVNAGARIIGINNRDLHTFDEDIGTTLELLPYVPEDSLLITESAIHHRRHVEQLSDPRINAMLVGTTLMRAPSIPAKMAELLGR